MQTTKTTSAKNSFKTSQLTTFLISGELSESEPANTSIVATYEQPQQLKSCRENPFLER